MRSLITYVWIAAGCMLLSPTVSGAGQDALFAQGRANQNLAVREADAANANQKNANQAAGNQSKGQSKQPDQAARDAAPNAALVEKTFHVGITLGDGRRLKGKIRVRVPERLSITHVVDGIQYRKLVRPEEIQAIELKRWRGRLVRQQEKGQIFQFDVDRYTIELNGGQVLKRDGELFVFLNQFVLENENGSVQLFSFWGDLQKKDGSWFTGMQGPSTSRVAAHKDVVQRIEFDES
ncbi:MAG: hypothetical protein NXI24_05570 [bacterium]|nr:hypothetical protein [bacterium]